MGYLTSYSFGIQDYGNTETSNKEIVDKIMELYGENEKCLFPLAWEIEDEVDIETLSFNDFNQAELELFPESYDWYSYHDDMITLSMEFPDITFVLSGKGEDADDVWTNYYKNGYSYGCTPTIPNFNPHFLEPGIETVDKEQIELVSSVISIFDELKKKFPNMKIVDSLTNTSVSVCDLSITFNKNEQNKFDLSFIHSN